MSGRACETCQVVGVTENGKYNSLYEEAQPYLFLRAPLTTRRGEGALVIRALAFVAARLVSAALYNVSPADPAVLRRE